MLTEYIEAAMKKARYEILPDDHSYYEEIPGFQGVYANAASYFLPHIAETKTKQAAGRKRRRWRARWLFTKVGGSRLIRCSIQVPMPSLLPALVPSYFS